MKLLGLRFQAIVLTTLLGVFSLGFGAKLGSDFYVLTHLQNDVRESYELESQSREWGELIPNSVRNEMMLRLGSMSPIERADSWRMLLQTDTTLSKKQWRSNLATWQKNEVEFRRFTIEKIEFLQRQIRFWGAFGLVLVLILGLLMTVFVLTSVVRPLLVLKKRMQDFVSNRFTYQFKVPAPNEIGDLQSAFNTLAQRVLKNVDELTHLDHAKSEFLSIASHELRTPLTSIKGSLSLMRSGITGDLNEMSQNLLKIAESETDRLIRLINELLDLAKIEAGKFEVNKEWVSLNEIITKTFHGLGGLTASANVSLENKGLDHLQIFADADRIHQVLANLLSNAIKYSPRGGIVSVESVITENYLIEIRVHDQGRGISPEDQEILFQKFRQLTSAKSPLVKGTGLGLAIAKALVEEHGGAIGVRSSVGRGSTFFFQLKDWQLDSNIHFKQSAISKEAAA